jgi:lipopolysaccharide export system protein LptA
LQGGLTGLASARVTDGGFFYARHSLASTACAYNQSKIRAFMKPTLLAPTLLALVTLVASPWAVAEKADSSKPMFIEADALKHDESTKTTTFTGRVNATKGTLVLRASQMVVVQDASGKQVAQMGANPGERAFFRQKREGLDEFTEGEAETVSYDSGADKITLTGRSELRTYQGTRLSDRIQGPVIVYNNITEVFTVDGKSSGKPDGQASPASPGSQPPRIKAMLTPRNTPADEAAGGTLVPALRSSPRVTAPAGTRP